MDGRSLAPCRGEVRWPCLVGGNLAVLQDRFRDFTAVELRALGAWADALGAWDDPERLADEDPGPKPRKF